MNKILPIIMVTIGSLVITTAVVYAASFNITANLGGSAGDIFDLDGTMMVDSLKVGAQGTGGVTFFNGTIINNTTGTGNSDNPVTFGDNVRIDGRVYRGATAGTGDTMPFIINDKLEVAGDTTVKGDLTVNGDLTVSGEAVARHKVYNGQIDLEADGDETAYQDWGTDCEVYPTGVLSNEIHFKKIAVPELDLDNFPIIDISVENEPDTFINHFPEISNLWHKGSYYLADGYVYLSYKDVYEYCDDRTVVDYRVKDDYSIEINYPE